MATNPAPAIETTLAWCGIHHIALATPDLDATMRFYGGVLGMVVSEVFPSREGRGRHCLVFVKPGDDDTWGLHFFERANGAAATNPAAGEPALTEGPLLHIAFRLPDSRSALALRGRLRDHDVVVTEIPELGSFVFWDIHGMMLEVTWPQEHE
jgi:catechol 2,3-dioxygenase-like lactoylglutathione lyase family enzyme